MTTPLPPPTGRPLSPPAADVGVRAARAQDADDVGRVQAALWRAAFSGDLPPEALELCTPQAFAEAWRRSLDAPPSGEHLLLVAHAGGIVVGLLALGPCEDPDLSATDGPGSAEILVLGVHPEHRRAGHGSRLLAAAADLARDGGVDALTVWVPARHESTRAFLQGAGFAPDRARRERVVDADGRTVLEARLRTTFDGARE